MKKYDAIVIGSGVAGATVAERLANELNYNVLVIEKRDHIGGNMYDYLDETGVITHKYGPHLFHTNIDEVYKYITQFGEWFNYEHRVLGKVKDNLVPIPFNLTSIEKTFDAKLSEKLINILTKEFGMEKKIPILELRKHHDKDINALAEFIYENVFLYYTMKQWGQTPDEIDPSVTNRVPVFVSRDDRYFQDKYQIMPKGGYTKIFEKMLDNKNIDLRLSQDALDLIKFASGKIYFEEEEYQGLVIYTGAIDELFNYKHGALPYRTLTFDFERLNVETYQPVGTVNYPTKEDKFTRITEYKHMTDNKNKTKKTIIMREYPVEYQNDGKMIPYYPINNENSQKIYDKYLKETEKYHNLYMLGRLAQYKYYNMDLIINDALALFEKIKGENHE